MFPSLWAVDDWIGLLEILAIKHQIVLLPQVYLATNGESVINSFNQSLANAVITNHLNSKFIHYLFHTDN